ncbi:A/G-specific DNA-adenine glycosylase [Pustulibacterium marinum]|uniref:Adenine DNA glycosylase n=1 Tax=Pustulibacterium marinum TaxID=1224947 RepID=A0A1I7HCZ2_9FLAO|nr:A/G-specific adenine glycosylase [Pustulibacterium marinum]SFU58469.1 A/G-specific DNA-adenine glycosylase [Pustulibacterium marinum]
MVFSNILVHWYLQNKRDLPWRNTTDPYKIWLSEIMLQQTRVAQGLPYYMKFTSAFPKVKDLADASEDEVLKMWQGLGYYSRARNLHATAKHVAYDLEGKFPSTYVGLKKLKGVGDYTASAIASISFNEAQPVVDGNVYRVLSRYFGVHTPINSTEGIKYFKKLAHEVKSEKDIAVYNQAIMEFGATQCKPQSPNCDVCPLNSSCVALKNDEVKVLPVKLKKLKVKKRYFNYIVFIDAEGNTKLQKRINKGIWHNLFEFPLVETNQTISKEEELLQNELFQNKNVGSVSLYNEKEVIHKLSHQHLYTKFWVVHLQTILKGGISLSESKEFAVPVLIANFMEEFGF